MLHRSHPWRSRFLKRLRTAVGGWSLCAAAVLAAGCATRLTEPPIDYAEIALLPVMSPQQVYTENRMLALPVVPALIANSVANRVKSSHFDAHMADAKAQMGPLMTQRVLEELRARGLRVHVLEGLARDPQAPDSIDYTRVPTRHAVLHVLFTDLTMESSRLSSMYTPRMHVEAVLYASPKAPESQQQYLFYRYGADMRQGVPWAVTADPKYRYPDFDSLLRHRDEIAQGWRETASELARRIANDIRKPPSAAVR